MILLIRKISFLILAFLIYTVNIYPEDGDALLSIESNRKQLFTFNTPMQSNEVLMLTITYKKTKNTIGAYPQMFEIIFNPYSESVQRDIIMLQEGTQSFYWYPHQFKDGVLLELEVSIPHAMIQAHGSLKQALSPKVRRLSISELSIEEKISLDNKKNIFAPPASVEDIIHWKRNKHIVNTDKDFMLYRWQRNMRVFILVFTSDKVQSYYLKRLAFFVEKKGARGELKSDIFLSTQYGWGAHDYKSDDLARFFEMARKQNFSLNPYEYDLKSVLLTIGVLRVADSLKNQKEVSIKDVPVQQGAGSIVSITQSKSKTLQKILLMHELLHTMFFEDKNMQKTAKKVWDGFSKTTQQYWKQFMLSMGYDATFNYLVINELVAYLLQRPISSLSWYIPSRFFPTDIGSVNGIRFTQEIIRAATLLEEYIRNIYNMQAGYIQTLFIVNF